MPNKLFPIIYEKSVQSYSSILKRRSSKECLEKNLIGLTTGVKYPCFYCKQEFPCEGSIYTHLTTLRHLGLPEPKYQANPEYQCNVCGSDVPLEMISKHLCVDKAVGNYWEVIRFLNDFGSPNMCLLCRGMLFQTPAHLNVHILMRHTWSEFDSDKRVNVDCNPNIESGVFRCPICLAIFRTKDDEVIHQHAFEEHVPEIGIQMLNSISGYNRAKYGNANDMKQWLAKSVYQCYFPNSRVKRFPQNKSKNIHRSIPEFQTVSCKETFSSLLNLTTHLVNFHFLYDLATLNDSQLPSRMIKQQMDYRSSVIQQEIEMRRRNLFDRGVIANKISARLYCIECFRIYDNHLALQIHYVIFHLNFYWNICSICQHDCKQALTLKDGIDDIKGMKCSDTLLWHALWNHEENHAKVIIRIMRDPVSALTLDKKLLPDCSEALKSLLTTKTTLRTQRSIQNDELSIPKHLFTLEQMEYLKALAESNERKQTDFIVKEFLNTD